MVRPPSPEQWVEMRPTVTNWYLREQKTARWIADEIKRTRGLCVTTKMLRDRFRAWKLKPKYNKVKTRPRIGSPSDEQPQEDVPDANALTERKKGDTHAIHATVPLAINNLHIVPDIGRYHINPAASPHNRTTSETLCKAETVAYLPSGPENRSHGVSKTTNCNRRPMQDIIVSDWAWEDKSLTSMPPNSFRSVIDSRPSANDYGSLCWYPEGPMSSGSVESLIDMPPKNIICGNQNVVEFGPSRPPNTATELRPLTQSLKAIQNFFQNLTDKIHNMSLRPDDLDKMAALEVQCIAANAHQAVASQRYSSHKTFEELRRLEPHTENILAQLGEESMHPRVLTVLLRLIIDSTSNPDGTVKQSVESEILRSVKQLFGTLSAAKLFGGHPVALVCSMPEDKDQTDQLLHYQVELAKVDLYDKIRSYDPIFVAREEIYTARVLTSLGWTDKAKDVLETVFDSFSKVSYPEDLFTHADACRTWGYTKLNAGFPEQAIPWLNRALAEFRMSGNGNTENVLYTHIALSWVYRRMNDLDHCEQSLRKALELWKSDETLRRNQSGIKFIRDLDEVLSGQGKLDDREELRRSYPSYFEETWD